MSRLDEIRARDNLAKSATYHRQGEDKELMTELRDALSDRAYLLDLVERAIVVMEDNEHLDKRIREWLKDAGYGEGE